jgi:hypothetical protein
MRDGNKKVECVMAGHEQYEFQTYKRVIQSGKKYLGIS